MSPTELNSLQPSALSPAGLVLSRRNFLMGALGGLALIPEYAAAQTWTPPAYRVIVEAGALNVSTEYTVDLSIVVQKHGGGQIVLYNQPLSRTGGGVPQGEKTENFILTSFELRFSYTRNARVPITGAKPTVESVYITKGSVPISMRQSQPVACSGSVSIKVNNAVSPAVVTLTLSKT